MRSRVQVSDPLQNTKGHLYARCPFFVPRLSSSTDLRTTLCPAPFGCVRPPCFILPRPANPGRHLALSRREYFKNFLCRMKSVGYILLPKKILLWVVLLLTFLLKKHCHNKYYYYIRVEIMSYLYF